LVESPRKRRTPVETALNVGDIVSDSVHDLPRALERGGGPTVPGPGLGGIRRNISGAIDRSAGEEQQTDDSGRPQDGWAVPAVGADREFVAQQGAAGEIDPQGTAQRAWGFVVASQY
jgi:hypothetical protein